MREFDAGLREDSWILLFASLICFYDNTTDNEVCCVIICHVASKKPHCMLMRKWECKGQIRRTSVLL